MTDSALLELFHNGARERAFNLLMEKYQQKLYWHIRRIVNNHDHTGDVLQNTFIKAWQGLDNFRAESQLFSWLYRIATNESINFLNNGLSFFILTNLFIKFFRNHCCSPVTLFFKS